MTFFLLEREVGEYVSRAHSSPLNVFIQLIFFIAAFVGVLALTYFSTKYLGRMRLKTMSGRNISIVESLSLGIGTALHLVKVGERYFLVSAAKDNIKLISEIDAKNIKEIEPQEPMVFEKVMQEYLDKFKHRKM